MLRLISSRWVRLALAAPAAAAIVVAVLRLRRPPAVPGAASGARTAQDPRVEIVPGAATSLAETGPGSETRWPPAPVLGTPSAEVLRRYAAGTRLPAFLSREAAPRKPLEPAARRALTRWAAAACALCLFAGSAQLLEGAVFAKEEYSTWVVTEGGGGTLSEVGACESWGEEGLTWRTSDTGEAFCVERDVDGVVGRWSADVQPVLPDDVPDLPPVDPPRPEASGAAPTPTPTAWTDGSAVDADCHPVARTPRVRPIRPRVTRAVDRQWTRIDRWLRANAPETYRTLAAPARPGTIAVAEAQMGLRLPDDLRSSLLRHNGSAGTEEAWGFGPMGEELLGVKQIRDTWRMLCGIDGTDEDAEGAEPDPRTEWWDGRMIPFSSDGVGGGLLIDSVRRDVGKTVEDGPIGFTPGGIRIRSYYALLKATADALETGGTVGDWKPVLVGKALEWRFVRSGGA
ncbi:SMI1/KNR4 family protein [Streptosporangium carneum]|uniref:SMI1/KNR4 family protein n=1 Tax=Streptosporangium carneum TaxID=47481 RepID=UPI0031E83CE5